MGKMTFLQCPLCAWVRPFKYGISQQTSKPREVRFDKFNLENPVIYSQDFNGRGASKGKRGGGGIISKKYDEIKIQELPKDMKNQLLTQCKKIIEIIEKS